MKTTYSVIGLITATFLLLIYAHSIDNSEVAQEQKYEALQKQYDELETEYEVLQSSNAALQEQVVNLEKQLERFVEPVEYGVATAVTYTLPLDVELQQYTFEMCRYYGIEEHYELALAMMWKESTFDPTKISVTNDYGLMQINIVNVADLKSKLGIVDIMDEKSNIEAGVYLFSCLINEYEDEHKALMAYNMGPSNAAAQWERGNYTSTYSRDVMTKAELIKNDNYKDI